MSDIPKRIPNSRQELTWDNSDDLRGQLIAAHAEVERLEIALDKEIERRIRAEATLQHGE